MNSKRGFTLMELMVVIAIISIMTAIAVPRIGPWLASQKLSSSARDIYSMLQLSRLRAVKENANVFFSFNSLGYSAFVDNGSGGGIANDNVQNGTEPTIYSGQFGDSVSFMGASVPSLWFNSRGFASANLGTTITIGNQLGEQRQIILSQLGRVRIN